LQEQAQECNKCHALFTANDPPQYKRCTACRKRLAAARRKWISKNMPDSNRCTSCGHAKDDDGFKLCQQCRENRVKYRERRMHRAPITCSHCGRPKASDGFKTCERCRVNRKKYVIIPRKRTRVMAVRPRRVYNQKTMALRDEFVTALEQKAAEKGISRKEVFAELVDRHLSELHVW